MPHRRTWLVGLCRCLSPPRRLGSWGRSSASPRAGPVGRGRFELETRRPVSTKLQSAAGGSHARWLLSPTNVSAVGAALQTGGLLTRALFDACDPHRAGELAVRDLDARLTELLYHADSTFDPAVANLARKIMREVRAPPPPCPLVARRVVVWSSDAPRFEPFARRWGRAHIVIARHGPCVGTHPASRRRGGLG